MKKGMYLFVVLFGLLASCATTKDGEPVRRTAQIQTNAQCGDCKERLEDKLNYETGVIYASLDMDTKIIEVKYNSKKTSLEKIKNTIAEVGYDADDVKAEKAAQSALPTCCQPGGHD